MKYQVRNANGQLTVGSYAELRTLYHRQFISDDDEICREGSDQWIKAGNMPDLKAIKPRPWFQGLEFAWLAVLIAIGTLIMVLFFQRR